MNIEFEYEKETKNTTRFKEVTDQDRATIGTLYVLKSKLQEIGWSEGKLLVVTLTAVAANE